jgi:hypothetical protein
LNADETGEIDNKKKKNRIKSGGRRLGWTRANRDKRRENMDEDGTSAKLHVGETRREYKKRKWWGSFDLGGSLIQHKDQVYEFRKESQ